MIGKGGPVGRRLDFLAQEFNREANTLCSKSADVELTRIGLEVDEGLHRRARRGGVGQRAAVPAAPATVGGNRTSRREDARRQETPFALPGAELEDPLGR